MAKRAKKIQHHKNQAPKGRSKKIDRGFDFGLQMRVAAVTDLDFNQALRDAGVIGCAYGLAPVDGMSRPVPSITLIGTDRSAFARAYKQFVGWGCEEDGDVVDIALLLRSDGSYDFWLGPEMNRSFYRIMPQADLFDPLMLNISWIKHLDSTNVLVRDLKQYCASRFHPVVICAAIGDPNNRTSLNIENIPEWKGILKFWLTIIEQSETPDDPRFARLNARPSRSKNTPSSQSTPQDLCRRRTRTLDIAFPVSRERVRRSSLVHDVRRLVGFESVTEAQVIQGAINLMLSDELVPGDTHYRQITGDLDKKIWDAIISRVEMADGACRPSNQEPITVARQIDLDVRTTLVKMKARNAREPFPRIQAFFRQEGYADD